MNEAFKDSKLNQKELNKILPSYIIDELEETKEDSDEKEGNISRDSSKLTSFKKIIKNNNKTQNNILKDEKKYLKKNDNINSNFNSLNNLQNYFPYLSNNYGNNLNKVSQDKYIYINNNISSLNNFANSNLNIYNKNVILKENNFINYLQNNSNLYKGINNKNINIFNENHKFNLFKNNSIHIVPNINNFQNINEISNLNNNMVNPNNNINGYLTRINNYELANINISLDNNNNCFNFQNQNKSINNYNININNYIFQNKNLTNNFPNHNSAINIFNKNEINDFIKYINSLPMSLVNFLCTPKGTIEIQKKLEQSNNEHKIFLVNYLNKQGLSIIMKNTYGNYFFQQLIKKNEKLLISLIISYISEDFIDISKDFSGTFSLQALLDEITSIEEEQKILNCIKNYEMEMAFNKNSTHVLQKIVSLFPDNRRLFLNEIILHNFIELCLDPNGICLIKIFIKTNTLIENKKRIYDKITENFVILAQSPFGNYGIQYLMEIWNNDDMKEIQKKIIENIYELSLQQYSSNVIEKAIEIFEKNRIEIIKKLCFDEKYILILIKNKFGKYVLNKAIKYMELDMKNEFEKKLTNNIKNNCYKNKDKNRIKKLLIKLKNDKFNQNENSKNTNEIFGDNNIYNNMYNNGNNILTYSNDVNIVI